jgi:hypothetical protein
VFACACEVVQSTTMDAALQFPEIHRRLRLCPTEMVPPHERVHLASLSPNTSGQLYTPQKISL